MPVDSSLAVWYLNIAVALALILKFILLDFYRTYPYLFWYLTGETIVNLVLISVPMHSNLYAHIYFIDKTIITLLAIGVVLELYRRALSDHPALASFGSQAGAYLFAGAALLALIGVLADRTVPSGQSVILHRFYTFERSMELIVAVVLFVIALFLLWFPVRMNRNVAIFITGFIALFFSRASGLLFVNMLPVNSQKALDTAMLSIYLACLLAWMIALRREGEQIHTVPGHHWNRSAVVHLTQQLDSINAALVRFTKN